MKDLEETVELLEAGDLPLEESLVLFEKGVGSLKRCHAVLDQAEKRVRMLVKSANEATELEDVTPVSTHQTAPTAPVRKKSVKQSIDLEPSTRQNGGSLTVSPPSPAASISAGECKQPLESGHEDTGLGGSLFAVSK